MIGAGVGVCELSLQPPNSKQLATRNIATPLALNSLIVITCQEFLYFANKDAKPLKVMNPTIIVFKKFTMLLTPFHTESKSNVYPEILAKSRKPAIEARADSVKLPLATIAINFGDNNSRFSGKIFAEIVA